MDKTLDLILHKAQWEIFNDTHRFRVCVNGRRFGKTALGMQELIYASLGFQGTVSKSSPEMVIGVLPTAVQARPILFKPLVNLFTTTALADLVENINLTEMRIDIKGKPSIKVAGANDRNGDRLRGNRIYFILMDEAQDILPVVFNEVIRPAMTDTKGSRALIQGTPKGKMNILHKFAQMEDEDDEWKYFSFPTWSNPCIPREEIEKARRSLPPRVFAQEYEAGFVNFEGQWYSELDSNNMHEGTLPHFDLVSMGVDFGDLHPAIVVCGRDPLAGVWYYLDGWSPNTISGQNQPVTRGEFDSNLKALFLKHSVDLIFCDPSRPSEVLAIRDIGAAKGYKSAVQAFNGIQSGIGQIHSLIHQNKLKFVKRSASTAPDAIDGTMAYDFLQSYTRTKDRFGNFTDEPADGSCSHICDALRYCLAVKGK